MQPIDRPIQTVAYEISSENNSCFSLTPRKRSRKLALSILGTACLIRTRLDRGMKRVPRKPVIGGEVLCKIYRDARWPNIPFVGPLACWKKETSRLLDASSRL